MGGKTVLLTGATGFIGGRLLRRLRDQGTSIRCLVRSQSKFRTLFPDMTDVEVSEGDLVKGSGLDEAMQDVQMAYYLVHSMGPEKRSGKSGFEDRDRTAAENFIRAGDNSGVERVIYLSGLGEQSSGLSKRLSSRQ